MSLLAESELLTAVRNLVTDTLALEEDRVTIELDEEVPAIAADLHVIVSPGGITTGPRHNSSHGTTDLLIAVRVTVFRRITSVPRDRRRNAFLDRLAGINTDLDSIMDVLDYQYTAENTANTAMDLDSGCGFVEPMRTLSFDPRPIPVFKDNYAAGSGTGGDPILALKRGITFGQARFLMRR